MPRRLLGNRSLAESCLLALPVAVVAALALAPMGLAQDGGRSVAAHRSSEPLSIDGRLEEPAWAAAEVASGFWQRDPDDRVPATEETELRVVFTENRIYFGVHAHDSEPEAIIAREMERDARLDNDDSIAILLDTFRDRRNAYVFEVNPNGARTDGLVTDEGRNINREWDGVWAVATRRVADGWIAEIGIPFTTLRFDRNLDTWGLNVRRLIRRKNEETNWTQLTRDVPGDTFRAVYALFRVSLAGELTGLDFAPPKRQLHVKPYVLGEASEKPQLSASTANDFEGGLDVKWGLTRSLVLDLTYNTDFAEVEVDDLQINLTRFSLFFPEKREFFLENAGIFDFGPPQRETFEPAEYKLFFSRRIGLERGEEVPIDYGGRITGRVGGWNVGAMSVLTEAVAEEGREVPETVFSVARLSRNIGRRSTVGFIFTDRAARGGNGNQVAGVDLDWKPTSRLSLHFFDAVSDDDRVEDHDNSYALGLGYEGRDLRATFDLQEVEEGFIPGMGFLLRGNDYKRYNPRIRYLPRIERWGLVGWYLGAALDYFERSSDGQLETRKLEVWPVGFRTYSGHAWRGSVTDETERLLAPFEIRPGVVIPPGTYDFNRWSVGGRSDHGRPVAVSGQLSSGGFFDGDQDSLRLTLQWRASKFLRSSSGVSWNDVDLPAGDFITRLYTQQLDVSFTPDLRLNALAQYNHADDFLGLNLRLNWTFRDGSDLYVVYNHNWDATGLGNRMTRSRQLIVKTTYLFQP